MPIVVAEPFVRAATIVVAPSDASPYSKGQADRVLPGENDHLVLNSLISSLPAAGGRILVLEGTVHLGGYVDVNERNLALHGVGQGRTRFRLGDGVNTDMIQVLVNTSTDYRVDLAHFSLNGNKANQTSTVHGIVIRNLRGNNSIRHVTIESVKGDGLRVKPENSVTSGLYIDRVVVAACDGDGINLDATDHGIGDSYIVGVWLNGNYRGIYLHGAQAAAGLGIANSIIEDSQRHNIQMDDVPRSVIVQGCLIEGASQETTETYDDIYLSSCTGVLIEDNDFDDQDTDTRYAVNLEDCNDCVVRGNRIGNKRRGAIVLNKSSYCQVINNHLRDNCQSADDTYDEILLTDDGTTYSTYNQIIGNIIRETATNKARYGIAENDKNDEYNTIKDNEVVGAVSGATNLLAETDRLHTPWPSLGTSGDYITPPPFWRETGSDTLGADTLWYMPFALPEPISIDRLAVDIPTAGLAGARLRVGIYTDVDGRPGELVVDGGEIDVTTTGDKEVTVDVTLGARRYWMACLTNDGTMAISTCNTGYTIPWTSGDGARQALAMTVTQTYGALPSSATAPTSIQYRVPMVAMRLK
jgi:parallel beta-helix repeat protein